MVNVSKKKEIFDIPLQIRDCGLSDYREILELQLQLHKQRLNGEIPNTILIVEHHPVITLGARESKNKLLKKKEELEHKKIDVVNIRRGGGTTAHNPGQLVFYPIMNLRQLELGISDYIRKLEAIGVELLRHLGLESNTRKGFPGLWAKGKKIASIGVRVSKFVTYHGMAINIQNDLSIFDYIIPCGLDDIEMTSLYEETDKLISMKKTKDELRILLIKHFSK